MTADGSAVPREPITGEDAAGAVRALRAADRWLLSPARWVEVDRVATDGLRAVATDDGRALRAGIGELTLLGPVRPAPARPAPPVTALAPYDVRADLIALINALTGLADLDDPRPLAPLPITIYLRDESGHERVEQAVEDLVGAAGFSITERADPVLASWYRRMWAKLDGAARTPAGQAVLEAGAHRADLEFVQRPDAEVAALLLANVAPLLATLQTMGDTVIYLGVMLIVKSDGMTLVYKLTPHQQLVLNNAPHLLKAPERILQALGLPAASADRD